jgi:hypothetical protein
VDYQLYPRKGDELSAGSPVIQKGEQGRIGLIFGADEIMIAWNDQQLRCNHLNVVIGLPVSYRERIL